MLKHFPDEVYVPAAKISLTSRKVLTMEYVPGRTYTSGESIVAHEV